MVTEILGLARKMNTVVMAGAMMTTVVSVWGGAMGTTVTTVVTVLGVSVTVSTVTTASPRV